MRSLVRLMLFCCAIGCIYALIYWLNATMPARSPLFAVWVMVAVCLVMFVALFLLAAAIRLGGSRARRSIERAAYAKSARQAERGNGDDGTPQA